MAWEWYRDGTGMAWAGRCALLPVPWGRELCMAGVGRRVHTGGGRVGCAGGGVHDGHCSAKDGANLGMVQIWECAGRAVWGGAGDPGPFGRLIDVGPEHERGGYEGEADAEILRKFGGGPQGFAV